MSQHTFTLATTDGEPVRYRIRVSHSLGKSDARGASINSGDKIDDNSATGVVGAGRDSWAYSGKREAIELSDPETTLIAVNDGDFLPASKYGEVSPLRGEASEPEGDDEPRQSGGASGWGDWLPPEDPSAERYGTASGPVREGGDPAVEYVGETGSPLSYTTEPMFRYIDPVDGDDSWPGTREDPLATIGEFVSRLPGYARHGVKAILRKGRTYVEGSIHFPHTVHKEMGSSGGHDTFTIGAGAPLGDDGEGADPLSRDERDSIVVKSKQIGVRLHPYATPNTMTFHNFKLEGCIQNRWGAVAARHMTLDPAENYYFLARGMDTYGGSIFAWDSTIAEGAPILANTAQHGHVAVRNCEADDPDSLDCVVRAQATDPRLITDEGGNEFGGIDFIGM